MNILLNKRGYKINTNEFNTIVHNEYNNLVIREKLGHFERVVSLLADLSQLSQRCLFFSQSHGGFVPISVASNYDNIYLLNTYENQIENLKNNISGFNVSNAKWSFESTEDTMDLIVYSENYDDIDENMVKKVTKIK